MLGSIGVDLAALYAPVDVDRFLQAAGDILIESCHFRTTGRGSFTANLALKKLASHRRLIIPSMQVSREGNTRMALFWGMITIGTRCGLRCGTSPASTG